MAQPNPLRDELLPRVKEYVRVKLEGREVVPIERGANCNYAVDNAYLIKIGTRGDLGREKAALELYAKNKIPTPKVVLFDDSKAHFKWDVLVTKYVAHEGEEAHNWVKLGGLLKKMHAIQCSGVGVIDSTGKGKDATWKGFLDALMMRQSALVRAALGSDASQLVDTSGLPTKHALLHLDFAGDNVLQKNGKVVAVIDPHGAVGDPLLDVAYTLVMTVEKDIKQKFLQGYSPKGFSKEEWERLYAYRTIALIDKLGLVLKMFEEWPERTVWFHKRRARCMAMLTAVRDGRVDQEWADVLAAFP